MNRLLAFSLILFFIVACKKGDDHIEPEPTMEYKELQQAVVNSTTYQRVDLDDNGTMDFTFSTRMVNDPANNRERMEFTVTSRIDSYLMMVNSTNSGKKLNKGDSISLSPPAGSSWTSFTLMLMVQKNIPQSGPISWDGEWKNASHHFLPVKITKKNGEVCTGWIEISMDLPAEKIVLHRSAYSILANKGAKAGE